MRANGWLVAVRFRARHGYFIPSLQLTSVANVAIIIAVQPFAAAGIAWLWLREAAAARTMLASLSRSSALSIIVSGARRLRH